MTWELVEAVKVYAVGHLHEGWDAITAMPDDEIALRIGKARVVGGAIVVVQRYVDPAERASEDTVSDATDRADRETLEFIGREPGCSRKNGRGHANVRINVAAATRLINTGLVTVTGRGKLYLTERGTEAVWGPFEPRPEERGTQS